MTYKWEILNDNLSEYINDNGEIVVNYIYLYNEDFEKEDVQQIEAEAHRREWLE